MCSIGSGKELPVALTFQGRFMSIIVYDGCRIVVCPCNLSTSLLVLYGPVSVSLGTYCHFRVSGRALSWNPVGTCFRGSSEEPAIYWGRTTNNGGTCCGGVVDGKGVY